MRALPLAALVAPFVLLLVSQCSPQRLPFEVQPGLENCVENITAGLHYACATVYASRLDSSLAQNCWGDLTFYTGLQRQSELSYSKVSIGKGYPGAVPYCGLLAEAGQVGRASCFGSTALPNAPSDDIACKEAQLIFETGTFRDISTGGLFACVIRTVGTGITAYEELVCHGDARGGKCGRLSIRRKVVTATPISFTQVSLGFEHVCALLSNKRVLCFGSGSDGQSAIPGGIDLSVQQDFGQYFLSTTMKTPIILSSTVDTIELTTGWFNTCVLNLQGRASCWGSNAWQESTPDNTLKMRGISAGYDFVCAVTVMRTAQCWGRNNRGQVKPPLQQVCSSLYAERAGDIAKDYTLQASQNQAPAPVPDCICRSNGCSCRPLILPFSPGNKISAFPMLIFICATSVFAFIL